jgi:hypothetical protein
MFTFSGRKLRPLTLLPVLFASSLAYPMTATAETAAQKIERLQRQVTERDQVIADLLRRMAAVEQQVGKSAAGPAAPAQPAKGQPAVPARPATGDRPASPAEEEAEPGDDPRALERTLVQRGGLLLPAGRFEIEPEFTYTYRGSAGLGVFEQAGQQVAGDRDLRIDTLEPALGIRVGLPWDLQADLRVPYRFDREKTTLAGTANRQSTNELGDIEIGLTKQILREGIRTPSLLASVTGILSAGDRGDDARLGSGSDAIQAAVTAVKSQDPLVFVGSLSYSANLEDKGAGRSVDPGDQIGVNVSSILAVSPETSLSFGIELSFFGETEADGQEIAGSDGLSGVLELGLGTVLTPSTLLSITAGMGITEDAPDFRFGVSLPIRF